MGAARGRVPREAAGSENRVTRREQENDG
jgi:hypothetical protein